MKDEKLRALADVERSSALDELERLVLRYAQDMTQTPVRISDDTFEQLQIHFTDRQLVELTSCIAWENYRARFDHAFGCDSEGFSADAFCPIPVGS